MSKNERYGDVYNTREDFTKLLCPAMYLDTKIVLSLPADYVLWFYSETTVQPRNVMV